jgi:two-component system CheB/CheR fusion protein
MNQPGLDRQARDEVLTLLASRRGVDFRDYRDEALERGLRGRLAALDCRALADYRRRLEEDPGEVDRLLRSLVVPYTGFFRDPAVFEALRQEVLPPLFARGPMVRAFCVGVASGEEAWTMAMLLADAGGDRPFEVIATDLDDDALEVARRARYRPEALAAIPPSFRARFVEGEEIAPSLRGRARFARHDLMGRVLAPAEAVLASFGLVLARNVLIYFDRRLQRKALDRLAAVLEPGGALVLGDSESLPLDFGGLLEHHPRVAPHLRIYQRGRDRT